MPLDIIEQRKRKNDGIESGRLLIIIMAILAGISAGCSSSAQPKAPVPAEVNVTEVICKQLGDSDEFTGCPEPLNFVEVSPRASGLLEIVDLKEASFDGQ